MWMTISGRASRIAAAIGCVSQMSARMCSSTAFAPSATANRSWDRGGERKAGDVGAEAAQQQHQSRSP